MSSSNEATQINQLVLLADRLSHVQSRPERRVIQREIETTLATLATISTATKQRTQPHIDVLANHLADLYDLVGKRLTLQKQFQAKLLQFEEIQLNSTALLQSLSSKKATLKEEERLYVQKHYLKFIKFLASGREYVMPERQSTLLLAEKRMWAEMQALKEALHNINNPLLLPFTLPVLDAEIVFFGPEGLLPTLRSLAAVNSETVSAANIARSMTKDLTASQSTFFTGFITKSSDLAKETARELASFNHFFILTSIAVVALAGGLVIFLHRTFLTRLVNLNSAVLNRVQGIESPIATEGADEIAEIARSVDYFAKELGIAKDKAEASSKAKSAFIANIGHEIRTPMNAILGFTRMLKNTEPTTRQGKYIEKMEDAARILLTMFNDILDFSTLEQGKLQGESLTFDVYQTLEQLVDGMRSQAERKQLHTNIHIDKNMPRHVTGMPSKLYRALSKLCDNAIKFTNQGSITLSVHIDRQENDVIWATFSVADTGIGLTEKDTESLYQPFFQIDSSSTRAFGGMGLGLTISSSLCTLMGGTLHVTSVLNAGSTFFFTIPLTLANDTASKVPEDLLNTPFLQGKHILLVEDNVINQEIALGMFEKTGAQITIAENGLEALEKIQDMSYDLVLMDIQMPIMDGITATQRLRELDAQYFRTLPIFAMTAHNSPEDYNKSLNAGMNVHLTKPLDPKIVLPTVYQWIQ